ELLFLSLCPKLHGVRRDNMKRLILVLVALATLLLIASCDSSYPLGESDVRIATAPSPATAKKPVEELSLPPGFPGWGRKPGKERSIELSSIWRSSIGGVEITLVVNGVRTPTFPDRNPTHHYEKTVKAVTAAI